MTRRRATSPDASDANIVAPSAEAVAAAAAATAALAGDGLSAEAGDVYELADSRYTDWKWWVYRNKTKEELALNPGASPRVLMGKVLGPLDVIAIQEQYGGGVFEFWGFFDGELRKRPTIEIDGPRKTHNVPPVVTTTTPSPATSSAPAVDNTRMDRLERMLERVLEQRPAPVAAAPKGLTFEDALRLFEMMNAKAAPPGAMFGEMVSVFKLGAELRGSVEPGDPKSTGEMILEKAMPLFEKIATVVASRVATAPPPRRRAPDTPPASAPGGPTPGSVSSAEVVEDAPEDAEASDARARIVTLVGSLARAIAEKSDPEDFALTVDSILTPAEVVLLEDPSTTVDNLLAQMNLATGGRHVILSTDAARTFVEAVLLELRRVDDDDAAGGSPPGA